MIRLAVRVRREDAEVALAELLALAPSGVEEVDLPGEDAVEYAVYGAPGELPALPDLRAVAGRALVEVRTTAVADDWAQRWRAFHRPVVVGGRLLVRAPWHDAAAGEDALEVVVDPGQAFGTGAHATTRLSLELLLGLEPGRGEAGAAGAGGAGRATTSAALGPGEPEGCTRSVVDLGCGSGVLAIAAAKLGWAPVVALDHEREAVEATLSNAEVNGVRLEARRWDLRRDPVPAAELVLANLLRQLLLTLCERMDEAPRALIVSGVLSEEADDVARAFAGHHGLLERGRREAEGWAALLLELA